MVGSKFLKRNITKDQSRDTGMGVVLLLLLFAASTKRERLLLAAVVLHVINMIWPQVYRPVAVVWLGVSDLIGSVMSRVMLSAVFFLVVTPIGVIRRALGHDSLKLRVFKGGSDSVMVQRNHTFEPGDIERPY